MDKPPQHKPGHNIDGVMGAHKSPHRGQLSDARFARPPFGKLDRRFRQAPTRQPGFHGAQQSATTPQTAPILPTPNKLAPRVTARQLHPSLLKLKPQVRKPLAKPESIQPTTAEPSQAFTSVRQKLPAGTPLERRPIAKKSWWKKLGAGFRSPRTKLIAKRSGLVLGVVVLLSAGWLGWKVMHATNKVFGSNSSLLGFLSATPLKCENTGRCNILMAGNSADDPGHDGANLTDSIMIVSIDMKTKNALLLSVPRDLYVSIPGNGHAKINEAYPDGQSENFSEAGYATGGMGLLEKTISQSFGMHISYYALIDYSALKQAVDTVGGVTVNIQSDDPRGLYDPSIDWSTKGPLVKLSNGTHTLTGEQALDLARARGDAYGSYGFAGSDFTRTQDQRMMMLALKDKIISSSTLANPIKLGELFDAFGSNIHTDLQSGNIRRLYDLFKGVPNNSISSVGLNNVTLSGQKNVNLLSNYATPSHQSALIPAAGIDNFSQIQLYLKQLTSNDPVVREAATVVILNASTTNGLGAAETTLLAGKGMFVSNTANAPSHQGTTTIVDNSAGKYPATLAELKSLFGTNVGSNPSVVSTYPNAQFIIILGQNQPMPSSATTSSQ